MSKSELVEDTTPASALVDALFRQGLRTTATPPAEQVWQRIVQQVQATEAAHRVVGFNAAAIPPIPFRTEATYLLGMPARGGI